MKSSSRVTRDESADEPRAIYVQHNHISPTFQRLREYSRGSNDGLFGRLVVFTGALQMRSVVPRLCSFFLSFEWKSMNGDCGRWD